MGFGESVLTLEQIKANMAAARVTEAERAAQEPPRPARPAGSSRRRRTGTGRIPDSATRRRTSRSVQAYRARQALVNEAETMTDLKRARIEAGLSQKDAAAKCGVPYRTFQAIEAGRPARRAAADRIRQSFGVRVEHAS